VGTVNSNYLGLYWFPFALLLISPFVLTMLATASILYAYPFRSDTPILGGSARRSEWLFNVCCKFEG
jgi:hypothetical protein